jgi:hypothetical protein
MTVDTARILANLNVLRVERETNPDTGAYRAAAIKRAMDRIMDIAHKQSDVTMEQLIRAKVGGARVMSYIFEMHTSNEDLREVQTLLHNTPSYRAVYNTYNSFRDEYNSFRDENIPFQDENISFGNKCAMLELEFNQYIRVVQWMFKRVFRIVGRIVYSVNLWIQNEYNELIRDSRKALETD